MDAGRGDPALVPSQHASGGDVSAERPVPLGPIRRRRPGGGEGWRSGKGRRGTGRGGGELAAPFLGKGREERRRRRARGGAGGRGTPGTESPTPLYAAARRRDSGSQREKAGRRVKDVDRGAGPDCAGGWRDATQPSSPLEPGAQRPTGLWPGRRRRRCARVAKPIGRRVAEGRDYTWHKANG